MTDIYLVDDHAMMRDGLAAVLGAAGHRVVGESGDPTQALADIRTGCRVLEALGDVDVGQSVVVERGVVLAVEAVEGTDETIRRAGRLGRGSTVVVKTSKQAQDMRFDVPAVGPVTIATMAASGATLLAVEAGATLLLDRDQLLDAAVHAGIGVVGCTRSGAVAGFGDD